MDLCINDKLTTDPSPDDIGRAMDVGPHPEGWYLVVDDEADDSNIEATARADGAYDLTAADGLQEGYPAQPLTADQVKAILLKYLSRERSWRDAFTWTGEPEEEARPATSRSSPPTSRSSPPTWAMAIVIGTIALVGISALALQGGNVFLRGWLPFDSDYFFIGLIFLPMVVLVVVAIAAKMLEVRKAAAWSTAVGRVVKSGTGTDHHRFAGDATTVKTMPVVEYEFSVGGSTMRGNRIGIGEDTGGANTEATVRRYPVGAIVTVFYDPANPKNCVLERDIPKGVGKGLAILAGFVVVLAGVVYWLVTSAPRLVEQHYPNANAPVVIIVASLGVLALLIFVASWRLSRRAADWPLVRGTVLSSGTEKIEKRLSGRTTIHHAPAVEYGYRVNDIDYVSRQIKLNVTMSSSQSYAAGVAARYPQGSVVDVRYDPANPANAALENPTGMHLLLLVVAVALFAFAAHQAGVFS